MKITKTKSYKAAFTGIAAAVAITLSFLEGLIPTAAFMPPGAKAGFSNIAVMFAASEFGLIPALSVTLLKSLFVFLTRGATAFFYVTRRRSAQHPCDVFIISFFKKRRIYRNRYFVGFGS